VNQETCNKNLMLSVVRAFCKGDLEPLFAALSEDVVWKASAPREFFRFGGTHTGINGMKEYTALLFSRYSFARFEPKHIVSQGDSIHGVFAAEAMHLPTNKAVKSDISIRWTIKDGKIVEHQGFFDTAGVLMQQGELAA
jgi:ketosteroid isomerase-like protein